MSAARRILVVSYPYPPMPSTGANRWAAMTKYLRRAGHDVTVLTTSAFGRLEPEEEDGVVRVGDLIANSGLRALLRRPALPRPDAAVAPDKLAPALLTRVVVPDVYAVTWAPGAARAVRRIVAEREIDCLVTTSPYESGHLVGLAAGRNRPAWVADFRDSWMFEPWRPAFPTRPQRALDAALERRVVRAADRVVTVHATLAEDFRGRLGAAAEHVPNGWDPEIEQDGREDPPALRPDRLSVVHAGKLTGTWGRHPGGLFEGLRRLHRREPDLEERLEVVLAGRLDDGERRIIGEAGLGAVVRHVGHISRAAAAALQRDADVLLLLTSTRLSWEAPGKLFEYLAAGKPILALAEGTEAARVVRDTVSGVVVAPDDPAAIAAAFAAALAGDLDRAYAPRGLERFVYPSPAERMAEEIERAVASRSAGRRASA